MPVALQPMIAPDGAALILVDLQQVLLGPEERELYGSEPVDRLIGVAAALAHAARYVCVPVVHCIKIERPDGRGAAFNAPMWWRAARNKKFRTPAGSPAAGIIADLGPEPQDLIIARSRGASIFTGTELDVLLRGLGVRSLVVAGTSLNVGIIGACIEGISRGYEVVVPSDGVAAIPASYAEVMLESSIRPTAVVSSAAAILSCWAVPAAVGELANENPVDLGKSG